MEKNPIAVFLMGGGLFFSTPAHLGASPQPQETRPRDASQAITALDRDTTQKIRKAVVDDKSLSTYAHNVKILVKDGKVTLRGPVRSEDEKQAVAKAASSVAGAENVTNELTVEPSK